MKKLLGLMFASILAFSLTVPAVASTATTQPTTKTATTQKTKVKKNHKAPKTSNKPAAKTN